MGRIADETYTGRSRKEAAGAITNRLQPSVSDHAGREDSVLQPTPRRKVKWYPSHFIIRHHRFSDDCLDTEMGDHQNHYTINKACVMLSNIKVL